MTELLIVMAFLTVLSVEDIRWKEVHLSLLVSFFAGGCIYFLIVRQFSVDEFFGGIVSGAVVLLFSLYTKGALGSADGIVFTSTGAFLGLYDNMRLLLISTFMAGVGGLVAAVIFKRKGGNQMPLIPFITAGAAVLIGVRL